MTTKAAVQEALATLVVCFNGEIDTPLARVFQRALKDVPADIVTDAAQLLMDEAAGGRKFYPMPSPPDLVGACAKVIAKRRAAALAKFGDCVICHNTRWVDVEGENRVRRCDCFGMMLAAAEAAGKPLTLPPATHGPEREDEHG